VVRRGFGCRGAGSRARPRQDPRGSARRPRSGASLLRGDSRAPTPASAGRLWGAAPRGSRVEGAHTDDQGHPRQPVRGRVEGAGPRVARQDPPGLLRVAPVRAPTRADPGRKPPARAGSGRGRRIRRSRCAHARPCGVAFGGAGSWVDGRADVTRLPRQVHHRCPRKGLTGSASAECQGGCAAQVSAAYSPTPFPCSMQVTRSPTRADLPGSSIPDSSRSAPRGPVIAGAPGTDSKRQGLIEDCDALLSCPRPLWSGCVRAVQRPPAGDRHAAQSRGGPSQGRAPRPRRVRQTPCTPPRVLTSAR